ncbi:MAG TPA: hypothetical protein ENK48_07725 [Gammaproteobacteria bacterium]|nr:hypothetical protein [Gammaproteobacteria bacterium]
MSSNIFAPLRLEPRASRRLTCLLLVAHGGALLLPWTLPWPFWSILALNLVVIVSLARGVRHHVFRDGDDVVQVALWQADGRWRLETPGGVMKGVVLRAAPCVHPALVVLELEARDTVYRLVLFSDALPRDVHRRLRVRLRGGA